MPFRQVIPLDKVVLQGVVPNVDGHVARYP
jgi:hypothetical protein